MNIINKIKELIDKHKAFQFVTDTANLKAIGENEGKILAYNEMLSLLESEKYIEPPKYDIGQTVFFYESLKMTRREAFPGKVAEFLVLEIYIKLSKDKRGIVYIVAPTYDLDNISMKSETELWASPHEAIENS